MAKIIPIPIGPIYSEGPCRGMVHVIEKGDTLYRLGKRYHVSVGQLMFANPFVNVYNLQIGDELCIPISIQPRTPESRMQGELMENEGMNMHREGWSLTECFRSPNSGKQRNIRNPWKKWSRNR